MKLATQFLAVVLSSLLVSSQLPAQSNSDLQVQVVDDKSESALTVQITDAAGAPVSDAAVLFRLPETGPTATFADGSHAGVAYTSETGKATVSGMHWASDSGICSIRITATRGASRGGILIERQIGSSPVSAKLPEKKEADAPPMTVAKPVAPPVESQTTVNLPASTSTATQPAVPAVTAAPQPGTPEPKILPRATSTADSVTPRVSVTNASGQDKIHSGGISKKWIILAVVAAGAGAGVAMMGKGKSSSSSTTSTGLSIGTPTVSVGHP